MSESSIERRTWTGRNLLERILCSWSHDFLEGSLLLGELVFVMTVLEMVAPWSVFAIHIRIANKLPVFALVVGVQSGAVSARHKDLHEPLVSARTRKRLRRCVVEAPCIWIDDGVLLHAVARHEKY